MKLTKRLLQIGIELAILVVFILVLATVTKMFSVGRFTLPPLQGATSPLDSTGRIVGPACYADRLNRFSVWLPEGWYASAPPSANAVSGASVLFNYDFDEVTGNHGVIDFPPGSVKIQITSDKLDAGMSFSQWLTNSIAARVSSAAGQEFRTTATTPSPYTLGKYSGAAFTVSDATGISSLVINLQVGDGRVLIIGIMPADSTGTSDALSLLSALDASGTSSCTPAAVLPNAKTAPQPP